MQDILEQLLHYLGAVWRRRWIALATAMAVSALGWGAIATLPDVYDSETRIFVDTASVLNPLLRGIAVDNDVNAQVAIMRETLLSRPNLEKVARTTDLDHSSRTRKDYNDMLESLAGRIRLSSSKTNIFTISYTDEQRQRSYDVVQALMTLFVENNLGRSREDMASAQIFLDRQIAEYEAKLDEAEQQLARFKQEHMDLLPGQQGLQRSLIDAETALAQLEEALSDARARQAILQRELAITPEMLTQQVGGFGAGPPSNTEAQVMETRAQLETLRARYTDRHPDVQAAQRQLDSLMTELENQLQSAGPDAPAAGPGPSELRTPNPTYAELRLRLLDQESRVEALRRQIRAQTDTVTELQAQLVRVPQVEAQLQKLNRDYSVVHSKHKELLTRRETAAISSDREQQSDSVQFRIIEPPRVPAEPSGPHRALMMGGVLGLSLGVGVAVTVLLALMRTTYFSPAGLRRDFEIPVIGTVHAVRRPHARKAAALEGVGLGLAGLAFVGVFGVLLLLERQVGLPQLAQGGLTPHQLAETLARSWSALAERTP